MKTKNIELDVDYIGEQTPITEEESRAISDFIRRQKLLNSKKKKRSTKLLVKVKATV
jgi:hypothetical protein